MTHSQIIFQFIKKTIDLHTYKRLCKFQDSFESRSCYEDWLCHQKALIETLSEDYKVHSKWLMTIISQQFVSQMDLDSGKVVKIQGFYFDDNKGLVIV